MAFWQSEIWSKNTTSIYALDDFKESPVYQPARSDAWQLFQQRKDYDVVHTMGARESLLYGLLCWISSTPSKQIMAEVFFDRSKPRSISWQLKMWLYRKVAKRSSGVLTNSSYEIKSTMERLMLPKEKIRYLPLHTNIREPRVIPAKNRTLLSAGRSQRDYKTLLEAAKTIDSDILIICGNHDIADQADLPANVTVIKELPYDEYMQHLEDCYAVILPLELTVRSTGQVVALSAMGLGKPVIATRAPGTVDLISDREDGLLVDREDPAGLSAAANLLLKDQELYTKLSKNGVARVIRDHMLEAHGQLRMDLISELWEQAH